MLQTAPAKAEVAPSLAAAPSGHRHDIQVLRALAVGVVVAYHLSVPLFAAGFIGVDIFFVISGYLITRLLLVEIGERGSVRLGRFMARRVRRLLPMSFVTVIATLVLIRWRSAPLEQLDAVGIGEAAATYRANFTLAGRGTDYLTADDVSPFQHYWSLAVEEQFYLLLPLALAGLAVVVGRRRIVEASAALLGGVGVATFLLALAISDSSPPDAYFLLHTRAWEFVAGGLVAVADVRGRRPGSASSWRFVGMVALIVAMGVSDRLDFPGPGAVPAIVAASALVWAGVGAGAGDFAGPFWAPARWVGDRSYSIYLWHWPLIVLWDLDATPFTDQSITRVVILAATVVLSAVSYELVEKPLRNVAVLRPTKHAVAFLGVATLTGFLAVSWILDTDVGDVYGPDAASVTAAQLAAGPPAVPDAVPANVRPTLAAAGTDVPSIYDDDCHGELSAETPRPSGDCTFGGSGAGGTIVLTGDSHAAQWFDAAEAAAVELDAELIVLTRSSCSITADPAGEWAAACEAWRSAALAEIGRIEPDVVIAANANVNHRADPSQWALATEAGLASLQASAPFADVVYVLDMPVATGDVVHCLSASAPADCAIAADPTFDAVQRDVATAADAVIDVLPLLCDAQACPPVIGDVLVYRDRHHLSRPLVELLTPVFLDALEDAGLPS